MPYVLVVGENNTIVEISFDSQKLMERLIKGEGERIKFITNGSEFSNYSINFHNSEKGKTMLYVLVGENNKIVEMSPDFQKLADRLAKGEGESIKLIRNLSELAEYDDELDRLLNELNKMGFSKETFDAFVKQAWELNKQLVDKAHDLGSKSASKAGQFLIQIGEFLQKQGNKKE